VLRIAPPPDPEEQIARKNAHVQQEPSPRAPRTSLPKAGSAFGMHRMAPENPALKARGVRTRQCRAAMISQVRRNQCSCGEPESAATQAGSLRIRVSTLHAKCPTQSC